MPGKRAGNVNRIKSGIIAHHNEFGGLILIFSDQISQIGYELEVQSVLALVALFELKGASLLQQFNDGGIGHMGRIFCIKDDHFILLICQFQKH